MSLTQGRLVLLCLFTALVFTLPACSRNSAHQADTNGQFTLSVVGTNDIHGAVDATAGRGGLPLLAGYVNALRDLRHADGGEVLLLDGGDMWQGTLESNLGEGAEVVAAFNTMGYAAAAIGNHEFDFGPVGEANAPQSAIDDPRGALKARAAEAAFPLLAANLIDDETGKPVDWPNVRSSVMLNVQGVKIGVVGVVTKGAFITTSAANTGGLTLAPLAPSIIEQAEILRAAGAKLVIVTAHAGGYCQAFDDPRDLSSCRPDAEIFRVAAEIPAGLVNYIIAGHVHKGLAHVVNGIAITSAYSQAVAFGRVDFVIDRKSGDVLSRKIFAPHAVCEAVLGEPAGCVTLQVSGARPSTFEGSNVVADRAVVEVLQPAVVRAKALKSRELGILAETPIRLWDEQESPLGNLFTDAVLASLPAADIAIHNSAGGLRKSLDAGKLTFGELYEVFPFANQVVEFQLGVTDLEKVFSKQLQQRRIQISFSGLSVAAKCGETGLEVAFRRPDGDLLGHDDTVTVATSDFLATGGDGVFTDIIPEQGLTLTEDGSLLRDVVDTYLQQLKAPLQESSYQSTNKPRLRYPGSLPMSCEHLPGDNKPSAATSDQLLIDAAEDVH